MKKAQGLSLQTIVVAILALIVLIVIILIVTGKLNIFSTNIGSCSSRNGLCASTLEGQSCGDTLPMTIWTEDCACQPAGSPSCKGKKEGQCCVRLGG